MEAAMGRGRNKAKAQKVAREIKYSQQQPDFEALSRELRGEVEDERPARQKPDPTREPRR
jgi:hypothetical protein